MFIGRTLLKQWQASRGQPLVLHPRWGYVLLSAATVLVTYALLVQTWRAILGVWGSRLSFWTAARVWSISNLFRYLPGTLWSVPAMAAMAARERASSVAAAGSAVLSTIVNIACGIAVVAVAGWSQLDALAGDRRYVILGGALAVAIAGGLAVLPFVMPYVVGLAERVLGRTFGVERFPPAAVAYAIVGNTLAWVLYGFAFRWLVVGVVGQAPGSAALYLAVYAAAYVIGFMAFVVPAGAGVRDGAMALALSTLGLLSPAMAAAVAVASRVLLTVLEIGSGFTFSVIAALSNRKDLT